jgi:hypothetical protein
MLSKGSRFCLGNCLSPFCGRGFADRGALRTAKLKASQNLARVVSDTILVMQKKILSCLAMDIHHPPFMRRTFGNIYDVTPC